MPKPTCRSDDCGRVSFVEGLCSGHVKDVRRQRGDLCSKDGCLEPRFGASFCNTHSRSRPSRPCQECGKPHPVDPKRWAAGGHRLCYRCSRREISKLGVAARADRAATRTVSVRRQLVGPVERRFCVLPEAHPARWLREVGWPATWRKVFVSGPCAWCGDPMMRGATSMDHLPRYCSQRCQRRAGKASRSEFSISPVVRIAIYERDGWICQLCLEPVSPDSPPSDIWAATLDHIIPRSHGGSDEEDNLQLAHRWCNSVKGDGTYYDADILKVG